MSQPIQESGQPSWQRLLRYCKDVEVLAASIQAEGARKRFAETLTSRVLGAVWDKRVRTRKPGWLPSVGASSPGDLAPADERLVRVLAETADALDVATRGYFVGTLYSRSLPASVRSRWGVYYTPPSIVGRLLAAVDLAGCDWRNARALDPACGGAAFLAPLASRMRDALSRSGSAPRQIMDHLSTHLRGIEIDPFAAWMSQVLTELSVADLMIAADRRVGEIVHVGDALRILVAEPPSYTLVVGNPPYGKVRLPPDQKALFSRSLYGHANHYALFMDVALRVTRPGGVVAFVTPPSFLSGQYYKSLRGLLSREAPPASIDFVNQRDGVFDDVLQETALGVFRLKPRGSAVTFTKVSTIDAVAGNGGLRVARVGRFRVGSFGDGPWLLPRSQSQSALLRAAERLRARLPDYGLAVATGQLVWNRHKDQMRERRTNGDLPLVWAESVQPDGTFLLRSERANHQPYFRLRKGQDHLVTRTECLLVQRTTAKEQERRLVCALLPASFVRNSGGVVIENHLNILRPDGRLTPPVPLRVMRALLNSAVVDQLFRCMSGSVAVSAYELNALPLPDPEEAMELDAILGRNGKDSGSLERRIAGLYGIA